MGTELPKEPIRDFTFCIWLENYHPNAASPAGEGMGTCYTATLPEFQILIPLKVQLNFFLTQGELGLRQ